jgi:hypothetical protein
VSEPDPLPATCPTCLTPASEQNPSKSRAFQDQVQITAATALTEATGGNTKAVADEGGWASAQTVEQTYAHLAGDATLQAALEQVWSLPL